ncbi:putative LAZY family protein [Helianthus annuus]|nr:putative LAZY family protein [Helianthus annuus]KAJ0713594.1 putative LAZY family protein [Helianthus annuus]
MKQEESNDFPRGFLAIGTFGNNDLPTENEEDHTTAAASSPDLSEFTPEEIGKLQKELTKLLSKKPNKVAGETTTDLPLDRFLNCPSSLEVDRRLSTTVITNPDDKEEIDRTIRVILGRCKDICMENSKKAIRKKSISFLLKKMFVCSSGLPPMPGLHDRLPESRMERVSKLNFIIYFLQEYILFQLQSFFFSNKQQKPDHTGKPKVTHVCERRRG